MDTLELLQEQFSPLRDPSWRQKRVLKLVEHQPRPIGPDKLRDDDFVRTYRKFLLRWRKGSDRLRNKLFREDPGLFYAHRLKHHPDLDWRAILEARILARETDESIAVLLGTIPSMVDWYEKLFFNVRDRLHSRDYIVKTLMGKQLSYTGTYDGEIDDQQRHFAYKLFGYFGGPLVLDVIIAGFQIGPFPTKQDKVQDWLDNAYQAAVRQRASVAIHTFNFNKFTMMQLLELHMRIIEVTKQSELAGGAYTDYHKNIEALLDQIEMKVGSEAETGRPQELLDYEETAVEPRADEMMQLAEGHVPQKLLERRDFKRPEPEPEKQGEQHGPADGQTS